VFLEAGACGKTSVGGNNGGVPDAVIHGETGLLVDATKPEEASEALTKILSEDNLRSRLSENARRFAREHNWSASAADLLAHLK
jgi:phosphatidylinositol alpha-1,6-mannosyltransferase